MGHHEGDDEREGDNTPDGRRDGDGGGGDGGDGISDGGGSNGEGGGGESDGHGGVGAAMAASTTALHISCAICISPLLCRSARATHCRVAEAEALWL